MIYQGSCLCKKVKYEISGDFEDFYLCHCRYCRKDSGSAYAANLFSKTATLKWLHGQNHVRVFKVADSDHQKAFCINCGTPMPNLQFGDSLLVVPAGSLDTRFSTLPNGHIFMSNKADWDKPFERLKTFETYPIMNEDEKS